MNLYDKMLCLLQPVLYTSSSGHNVITWYNATSDRIIFAGEINIMGDERLSIEGSKGRRLRLADISEFDAGGYRCQVEVKARPISLEHTLNVLGKCCKGGLKVHSQVW